MARARRHSPRMNASNSGYFGGHMLAGALVVSAAVACGSSAPHVFVGDGPAPSGNGGASPSNGATGAPSGTQGSSGAPAFRDPGIGASGGAGSAPSGPMDIVPVSIDKTGSDNPAHLPPDEVKRLIAGGPVGSMKWLYPYEGTVFPGAMISPLVMWHDDAVPDAVYVHMKSTAFEYKGVLVPAKDGALFIPTTGTSISGLNTIVGEAQRQLAIPQDVWDAASTHTYGKGDVFTLEVTERVNGQIHGPVTGHIQIARGSFKGSIFYSTCVSAASEGVAGMGTLDTQGGINSRILRIPPRDNAQVIFAQTGECRGCHSVSADGSRLLAQQTGTEDDLVTQTINYLNGKGGLPMAQPGTGIAFDLGKDGTPASTTGKQVGPTGAYGALYPDGSKYLSMAVLPLDASALQVGTVVGSWSTGAIREWGGYLTGLGGLSASPAALYDLTSGAVVPNTGIPDGASMPMFSPDGRLLVFSDNGVNDGRALAIMDYDTYADKATAYRVLHQEDATSQQRPGWPFFLPDDGAVVFVRSGVRSFTSGSSATGTTVGPNATMSVGMPAPAGTFASADSDLFIADVATGKVTLLAKAMGFDTPADAVMNKTNLPFGNEDVHHNYFPTVSPVAAAGYFWVFFDSLRHFGSLGVQRNIWGFAIDVSPDGTYTVDPSHPPFYVPGQEYGTSSNNHRAFAALDPCRKEGDSCTSGVDCCSGFCDGACTPPPMACSKQDEHCAQQSDCCDQSNRCINGFCSMVVIR